MTTTKKTAADPVADLAKRFDDYVKKTDAELKELRDNVDALDERDGFTALQEDVEALKKDGEAMAKLRESLEGAEPVELLADLEPGASRRDILKAFRQLEAMANHLNFRLPS